MVDSKVFCPRRAALVSSCGWRFKYSSLSLADMEVYGSSPESITPSSAFSSEILNPHGPVDHAPAPLILPSPNRRRVHLLLSIDADLLFVLPLIARRVAVAVAARLRPRELREVTTDP
ncbi:hypothetical protein U1Q18_040652 [Sarracenia purpurea var. burkii]